MEKSIVVVLHFDFVPQNDPSFTKKAASEYFITPVGSEAEQENC